VVERKLPNGMIETYVVEERGFRKGMHSIPDHYQMKVRKVETMRSKPNRAENMRALCGESTESTTECLARQTELLRRICLISQGGQELFCASSAFLQSRS